MDLLVLATAGLLAVAALPYLAFLGLYAWVRPAGSPADKEPAEPTVSVVLPTYNEEPIIDQKLEDLCNLNYPLEQVEVVLADDSDDDTVAVAREFFADRDAPSLKVASGTDREGVATAVNRALDEASGEVVLRTDADSKLDDAALREAVANLADDAVDGVTGLQADVLGDSEVEADYRGMLSHIQALESHLDSTFIAHGPCFAFVRDAFEPIAPDSLADDTEIAVRIRRNGGRVVMDPAMRFAESGVSAFGKRRTRKDRRAMGLVQLLWRNRDALGRYGNYGRLVLPFNWWFMMISPWLLVALAGTGTAAAVSVAGWTGLLVPLAGLIFAYLGQRDALGPAQPLYALVDAQVSLLVAAVRFATGDVTGTWQVDRESREVFE